MTDRVSKDALKNIAIKLEKALQENRRLQNKIDTFEKEIYELVKKEEKS